MKVVLVYRSGGDYLPAHVYRLIGQIRKWHPNIDIQVLTDVQILGVECTMLKYDWPGWWAKMEMFRPDITGDFLYMDLDTAVIGDLFSFFASNRLAIMRDVYRKHGLQSSIMFIPERERKAIWAVWKAIPTEWMRRYRKGGDQAFLEQYWDLKAARWQDLLPGKLVSYKADRIAERGVPERAKVIIFHGKPRPWEVGW